MFQLNRRSTEAYTRTRIAELGVAWYCITANIFLIFSNFVFKSSRVHKIYQVGAALSFNIEKDSGTYIWETWLLLAQISGRGYPPPPPLN